MQDRILIVGGGIAGAATAFALGQLGLGSRVLLLERERTLGRHATGQNAAILRTAINAHATRTLALETARFLRTPPAGFTERPLLSAIGVLVAEGTPGDPEPAWVPDHIACGEVQTVTRTDDRARPFQPVGARRWWFRDQGVVDVAQLLASFIAGARAAGVEIRSSVRVERLLEDAGTVRGVCLSSGERIEAAHTVLAAGGWADQLADTARCAMRTRVTRRHLLVGVSSNTSTSRMPVVWDDIAGIYARPESGGLLVSGCDQTDIHPDALVLDRDVQRSIHDKVERVLPSFAGLRAMNFWCGLRTLTQDDVPLIGPDPEHTGLFWLAGLGGHGISISAGLGRVAAALLAGEHIDPALRLALCPGRFEPRVLSS